MITREATRKDIPRLIEMGRKFYGQTGFSQSMPFDDASAEITLRGMMDGDGACVRVAEDGGEVVGVLGGVLNLNPYNLNFRVSEEKFWYVDEQARNGSAGPRLLLDIERWAKDNGARVHCMAAIRGAYMQRLSGIYVKRGYTSLEEHFVKEV